MTSKLKDKAKANLPTRPRDRKKAASNGVKKENGTRSARSSPSSRGSTATSTPASASPGPEAAKAIKQGHREASDSASEGSVKDFYAHIEASSSESSRRDTDSVLGAVLEDLTDETDIVGEFCRWLSAGRSALFSPQLGSRFPLLSYHPHFPCLPWHALVGGWVTASFTHCGMSMEMLR